MLIHIVDICEITLYLIKLLQQNLTWPGHGNLHQYFVTALRTSTQYFDLIVTFQPNLSLLWYASNIHQHFVKAHPTPHQYFGLIVTAQPNLNLPWDASNLNQHFVTTHPTLFLNNMSALRHFKKYFLEVLRKGNEF